MLDECFSRGEDGSTNLLWQDVLASSLPQQFSLALDKGRFIYI